MQLNSSRPPYLYHYLNVVLLDRKKVGVDRVMFCSIYLKYVHKQGGLTLSAFKVACDYLSVKHGMSDLTSEISNKKTKFKICTS